MRNRIEHARSGMIGATMQIKVVIPAETYRELVGHARARGIEVGELVSRLATASIKPDAPVPAPASPQVAGRSRARNPITPERLRYARLLHDRDGLPWKKVAAELGVSISGLFGAMKREGAK